MKYQDLNKNKTKYKVKVSYPTDLLPSLKRYRDLDEEHFLVVTLDCSHSVIGIRLITTGISNRTFIKPREIFRQAIIDNSASIILVHNHHSEILRPSEDDKCITKMLSNAGDLVGIKVLDHMIIGRRDYYSFAELNNEYLS